MRSYITFKTRAPGSQWLIDRTEYTTFRIELNAVAGHEVYVAWQLTYDQADATWFTFRYNITSGLNLMSNLDVYPKNLIDSAWGPSELGLMPAVLRFDFRPVSGGEIRIVLLSYTAECLNPYYWPEEQITFSSSEPMHEVVIHVTREELQLGPIELGFMAGAVAIGSMLLYFRRQRRRNRPSETPARRT